MAGSVLKVRVSPGASREAVGGIWDGPEGGRRLVIRVTAAPEKGKANKAVIAFLAKRLGVAKSAITLVSGETDRNKTFSIDGADAALAQLWAGAERG